MSLKMGPFMVDEYKQEWKNIMERRYGAGNCPNIRISKLTIPKEAVRAKERIDSGVIEISVL